MILDELELKQRYNDYLREVRQEQLYQQLKANQSNLLQESAAGSLKSSLKVTTRFPQRVGEALKQNRLTTESP